MDKAISEGQSIGAFQKAFKEIVARHGWETHRPGVLALSRHFETNLRQSYNAGRDDQIERIKHKRPLPSIVTATPSIPGELHLKWNNLVLPVDHPWWETHSPSNGYGCKCKKFLLSEADLKRRGLTVGQAPDDGNYEWVDKATGEIHRIPRGIDPGFDYRPKTPAALTEAMAKREAEKPALAERLPERLVESAFSTARGDGAGVSDLLAQLPAPPARALGGLPQGPPNQDPVYQADRDGQGAAGAQGCAGYCRVPGHRPLPGAVLYYTRRASATNGFTAKSWGHLVIKGQGGDTLKAWICRRCKRRRPKW